ncbi:MAG: Por secretion system protein [Prevotella sp.]|nr:Por secretion system protein [Prevotella sp.]
MKRNILNLLLTAALLALGTHTAKASGMGQWKSYLSYYDVTEIEQAGNTLYVLASNNLYSYNKNDNSITTYDKIRQLSDCNIKTIRYCAQSKKLLISYSNFNFDLLGSDGTVENISDYKTKSITGDKTIYDISIDKQFAYVSTGFGIMKINTERVEISDTYQLGFRVDYSYIEGDYIYAASSTNGLYRALLTDNLLDKNNWVRTANYTPKNKTIDPELLELVKTLNPDGPKHNYFGVLNFHNGKLYATSGTAATGYVQVYDGENWTYFEDNLQSKTGLYYKNLYCLAVNPLDESNVFVGCQSGIYEFKNGVFVQNYNIENSPLTVAATVPEGAKNYVMITGLTFDPAGNLWVLNSIGRNTSLFKRSVQGEWTSYHNNLLDARDGCSLENMVKPMIDSRGMIWFNNDFYRIPAMVCFNPATEETKRYWPFINEDGSTLSPQAIGGLAEDKDNNMWVGTSDGPLMLEPAQLPYSSDETVFQQIKVPRNDGTDLADYLLANVNISDIKIDGGGRKWFATSNQGVYLISQNNLSEVHHFTEENSGLLSNQVIAIEINPTSGEVFFATENGLCSYMSDANTPSEDMTTDNVYAYPNPVRADYTGPITITGLTYNADVKIMTVNGRLVAQGKSNGGLFTWDGTDLDGKRVAGGVYIVNTATQDGESGTVTKIAIIR